MSISKFQDRLFSKGGCGTGILIFCAMVFGAFAFQNWGRANQLNGGGQDSQGKPTHVIANIGGTPIESGPVDEAIENMQKQQESQGAGAASSDPQQLASFYGDALQEILNIAAVPEVAKSLGIQFSDDQLRTAQKSRIVQELNQAKMQAALAGKVKFGVSDADWSAYLKAQTGKSVEDIESQTMAQFDANLQDPSKRQALIADLGGPMVEAALASKVPASDADVKASFNQYTFKRILLATKPAPSPSVTARAATVKKDLASGTPFEQEMNRFSDDAPQPKKTVSESTQIYSASDLEANPSLAPLKSLKVGAVSDVISVPQGSAIYKLISIKSQVPPDFAKKIADYKKTYQGEVARAELQQKVSAAVKSDVKWQSLGYKAIYDVTRPGLDPKKAEALYAEAKDAMQKSEGYDLRPAELAEYIAFNMIWTAPGADQIKLRPERITVLTDLLNNLESFDVRMELVKLYEADKDGKLASENLLEAAGANNTYDAIGQSRFGDVEASMVTLKSEGLLTADKEKQIEDIQANWKEDKVASDKQQADLRAEEAKAKAEEDADRKKAAAEAKAAAKGIPQVKVKGPAGAQPPAANVMPPGTVPGTTPSTTPPKAPAGGPKG